jgi:hypothetical protein
MSKSYLHITWMCFLTLKLTAKRDDCQLIHAGIVPFVYFEFFGCYFLELFCLQESSDHTSTGCRQVGPEHKKSDPYEYCVSFYLLRRKIKSNALFFLSSCVKLLLTSKASSELIISLSHYLVLMQAHSDARAYGIYEYVWQ